MSKSIVRLALDGSVAWTCAAGEVPQQPGVDGAEGEVGVGLDAALGEQPLELGGREVRVEHEPGGRPDEGEVAGRRRSSSQRAAVRRSCHTMARWQRPAGAPVPRHDRLALVGDADGGDGLPSRRGDQLGERRPDDGVQISSASCSTQPGPGEVLGELAVRRSRPACPASSTAKARTPVVPASMAIDDGHGGPTLAVTVTGPAGAARTRQRRSRCGSGCSPAAATARPQRGDAGRGAQGRARPTATSSSASSTAGGA